jgi:hypothetical protein
MWLKQKNNKHMKTHKYLLAVFAGLVSILTSCSYYEEDPGPKQSLEEDYAILDFDRLEMGDAFIISVEQSNIYSVSVRGDSRNLDDLEVEKVGSTLRVRYTHSENRQYPTYVTITMPVLKGANFSGACISTVTGFTDLDQFDFTLSGASVAQVDVEAIAADLNISGASKVTISGQASSLHATVSGASTYSGFAFPVEAATVEASGGSKINVKANSTLKATASGASVILYRGGAAVTPNVSGASTIQED